MDMHYLVLVLFVFVAAVVPVFGPPSWVFAVYYRHRYGLSPLFVVFLAATATTMGRIVLAT